MPFKNSIQRAEQYHKQREKDAAKKRERDYRKPVKRKGRYDAFRNRWDDGATI
jgi:hypothetical protein